MIEKSEAFEKMEKELMNVKNKLMYAQERNKMLLEQNKNLLQQLLSPKPVPEQRLIQAPVPETKVEFKKKDVDEVERLVTELLDVVTFATTVEEGKLELKVPIEQIERIYNEIKDALKHTEYIVLFGQARNILNNIDNYRDDPAGLLTITKMFVQNVRLEFSSYHMGMGRRGALRNL